VTNEGLSRDEITVFIQEISNRAENRMYWGLNSSWLTRHLVVSIFLLVCLNPVWPHDGDIDAQGGHDDHSDRHGNYHFHGGPLAGQSFLSEESATAALDDFYEGAGVDNYNRDEFLIDRELITYFPAVAERGQIVNHTGYSVYNSEKQDQAEWIIYKIEKVIRVLGRQDKSSAFSASAAMSESYFLPKMSTQISGFNWQMGRDLDATVREYARNHKSLIVVIGPVFRAGLSIPDTYFKVLLDISEPTIEGLAFVVPSEDSVGRMQDYAVSIDHVEQLTGIDFFVNLDNGLETRVESRINYSHWNIGITPSPVDPKTWGEIKKHR